MSKSDQSHPCEGSQSEQVQTLFEIASKQHSFALTLFNNIRTARQFLNENRSPRRYVVGVFRFLNQEITKLEDSPSLAGLAGPFRFEIDRATEIQPPFIFEDRTWSIAIDLVAEVFAVTSSHAYAIQEFLEDWAGDKQEAIEFFESLQTIEDDRELRLMFDRLGQRIDRDRLSVLELVDSQQIRAGGMSEHATDTDHRTKTPATKRKLSESRGRGRPTNKDLWQARRDEYLAGLEATPAKWMTPTEYATKKKLKSNTVIKAFARLEG